MPWRLHGHVKVDARAPRAAAICDRCGFIYNHYALRWQFEFSGTRLQNLRILVCDSCYDEPQRQLGSKSLSPDPVPIYNARPEPFTTTGFSYQESNIMSQPSLDDHGYAPEGYGEGLGGDGAQMTLPDGTFMLMPNNPGEAGDYNDDHNNDFDVGT